MNELAVLLVASVVSLATRNLPVNAYHYVVPQDSCYNMFPVHNVSESQLRRASPYRILVPKNYYHPLEEMKSEPLLFVTLFAFSPLALTTISFHLMQLLCHSYSGWREQRTVLGLLASGAPRQDNAHRWRLEP